LALSLSKPGALRRSVAAALIFVLGGNAFADDIKPLAMEQVAPGIFVHQGVHGEVTAENHGGIANIGFIVGTEAVAVIDSGGSAMEGRRLRAAVRAVTDLPIRYVINTHVHPDHIFGNAAFVDDAPAFIGHAKLPGALAARGPFYLENLTERLGDAAAGTRTVPPTQGVGERREIDLGGRVLRLAAHPTAHTDNDLSVFDVRTSTLWLSDLLFMDRIPAIDGSLKGWLEVIAALRQVDAARVIPGHGPVSADWPGALDAQERYLRTLLDEIRTLLAEGGTMEQAVETVGRSERGKWLLFDDYHARNIVTAFTELEWE
jgi:quinoprotein relay system zinc metallohydrolase 2